MSDIVPPKYNGRDICFAGYDKENRHPEDFYPTDPRAVHALLKVEKFDGPIWEPACGDGAISKVLEAAGHTVISTDLVDRGYGTGGVDFLADNTTQARHIVTNPPFGLSDKFVEHALSRAQGGKVVVLFRSVWIQAQCRDKLRLRLSRIWACRGRLRIWRGGIDTGGSSPIDYSWFVWDAAHVGPTVTGWLPLAPVPRKPPVPRKQPRRKRLQVAVINPEPIASTLVMGQPTLRVVSSGPDLQAIAELRAALWEQAALRPIAIYSHDSGVEDAGKRPIGDDWGERALRDPPEAAVARPERRAANTGILARGLRPIDGDIDDPELAQRVDALAEEMLGPAPVRYRENSPRRLRLYRAASGTPKKREITGATHVPKVHGCKVETLGDGQQFVSHGIHPSGAELQWTEPLETASLTSVTEEQIDAFLAAAAMIIGAKTEKKADGPGDDADTADIVDIVAAFEVIPNNAPASWNFWNNTGLAAWVASGASRLGFEAWNKWSSKHPKYDAAATAKRWEHYFDSPPDRTGAEKLFKMARDACPGWQKPTELARAKSGTTSSAVVPFNPWDALQPPAFPMHAVPPILKAFVEDEAEVIGADACALAWSGISACSAAIDARIRLQLRTIGNWHVPPMIWVALVGGPSTKKSPTIRSTWGPLESEQQGDLIEWEKAKAAYAQLSRKERDDNPKPRCKRRLVTHNATPEAIQELLGFQHRGIAVLHDELAGWIGAQEKYTSGKGRLADRAFWLQAFDGGPYVVDRVEAGRGTAALSNLSVTVCGGIQPDRLRGMMTDDGLWQRFAPIIVGPARMSQEGDITHSRSDYQDLIRYLLNRDPKTRLVLSDAAHSIFEDVERRVFELEQSEILGPRFASFCGKLTGLWGRLALVLNLMSEYTTPHIVTWDAAEAARILLFESLLPCAARVYADMGGAGGNAEATQAIAGFILVKRKHRLLASDLTRNVRVCRGLALEDVQKRVSPLVAGGWLTPEDDFNPSAWRVNAAVHTMFAERARQQAEQRARVRDLILGTIDTEEQEAA